MAHGGYGKRRVAERRPVSRRSKGLSVEKKHKSVSLKNQIRSAERILRKNLPLEVREAQEKKLEQLKKQQEIHKRLAVERKIFLRDRKIKFFVLSTGMSEGHSLYEHFGPSGAPLLLV